jgi:hypothetical protein
MSPPPNNPTSPDISSSAGNKISSAELINICQDPLASEPLNGESWPFNVLPGTEKRRYSLALQIKAHFKSSICNTKSYLEGLNDVALFEDKEDITLYHAYENEVSSVISWVIILRFKEKPEEPFLLHFKSGFREWKLRFTT